MGWTVDFSEKAKKQYAKIKRSGLKKPSIIDAVEFLLYDLEQTGPFLKTWPNYGIIEVSKKENYHHCHIRKGHPTYVACWRVLKENDKIIEVFYVGSHENVPY